MNDNITKLIEELATKLGTTTEYLWGVLIKQAAVSGVIGLITIVLAWTGIAIYAVWLRRSLKDDEVDWDNDFGYQLGAIVGGVLSCVAFAATVFRLIPNTITALVNPEYWALQEILGRI